jgi:hypothetical protein
MGSNKQKTQHLRWVLGELVEPRGVEPLSVSPLLRDLHA